MQDNSIIVKPQVKTVENLFSSEMLTHVRDRVMDPLMNYGTYPVSLAKDPRLYDWYQFSHVVYDLDHAFSEYYDVCRLILAQALDRTDRKLDRLFKIRIINSLPGGQDRAQPHIDVVGPHQTGLFFPDDSDGNTDVMFERSWLQNWDTPETFNLAESLAPKANTWYDFDGTHWRYSGRPQKFDQRFCVVFNFTAKPKE